MDESGFEQEVIRAFGYTPVGKPCIDIYNYQKTKRTNVIGALYRKRLFAVDIFTHNINWQVVYDWFKYNVIPKLGHKCVIVMDNARFHKNKRIKKLLNRHGHRILWLPPYSPDLNPIEKKWAEVKKLRQGWGENNLNHLFSNVCCYNFKLDWLYRYNCLRRSNKTISLIRFTKQQQNKKWRRLKMSLEDRYTEI